MVLISEQAGLKISEKYLTMKRLLQNVSLFMNEHAFLNMAPFTSL